MVPANGIAIKTRARTHAAIAFFGTRLPAYATTTTELSRRDSQPPLDNVQIIGTMAARNPMSARHRSTGARQIEVQKEQSPCSWRGRPPLDW